MIPVRPLTLTMTLCAAMLQARPALSQEPAPAPKTDVVCVAIVLPTVEGVEGNSATLADAVRTLFASYLTGPSIKSVPLEARLPSQAIEEARQKDCGRVLTVALVNKRGGGHSLAGAITRAAGNASYYVPYSGAASSIAVGTARAGAEVVSAAATNTRAKDEMRMDYRVTAVDGTAILAPKSDKAKAKVNGEDIVTPLVAKAAEAIAAAVGRK